MTMAWKPYAVLFVLGWVGASVLAYGLLTVTARAQAAWRRRYPKAG